MSYAIIRNVKYKLSNLQSISRHNERKNREYGNKDIDLARTPNNYHLKRPKGQSYEKEFFRLREENALKGNLRLTGKKQSNVVCEFVVTSDADFFKDIGTDETQRYFKTAYTFACQMCGEENIISAVVHMDETTPHMHLTYIPVVEAEKKGQKIQKINCSEFWKGFNSYGDLQNNFHHFVTGRGFELQRGTRNADRDEKRDYLEVIEYKQQTAIKRLQAIELAVKSLTEQKAAMEGEISALIKHFRRELTRLLGDNAFNQAVQNRMFFQSLIKNNAYVAKALVSIGMNPKSFARDIAMKDSQNHNLTPAQREFMNRLLADYDAQAESYIQADDHER